MYNYIFIHLLRFRTYGIIFLLPLTVIGCNKGIETAVPETNFSEKRNLLTAAEWISTGQILFESRSISPKKISCKSCHDPKTYFQDGYEVAIVHNKKRTRNTPTLLNINRYTSFFWDGRASSLQKQLEGPLFSRAEMHSDSAFVFQAIKKDSLLHKVVRRLEVKNKNQAVAFVLHALEQYILSIATQRTKWHNSLNKKEVLSKQEEAGYDIFLNKAKCVRCHTPPHFTDNLYHDIGLPRRKIIFESYRDQREVKYRLGPDYGRGNIVEGAANLYAFRTPSLLNVAHTGPYMHDGAFNELEEVIDFYSRKDSILLQQPLSLLEKQNLLAFLKTLTDVKYIADN